MIFATPADVLASSRRIVGSGCRARCRENSGNSPTPFPETADADLHAGPVGQFFFAQLRECVDRLPGLTKAFFGRGALLGFALERRFGGGMFAGDHDRGPQQPDAGQTNRSRPTTPPSDAAGQRPPARAASAGGPESACRPRSAAGRRPAPGPWHSDRRASWRSP